MLVEQGMAVGIIAAQSIGERGTQLDASTSTMEGRLPGTSRRLRPTPGRHSPPADTPREVSGTQDITGSSARITEVFEARKPNEPAVVAEVDGTVDLLDKLRRGKTDRCGP